MINTLYDCFKHWSEKGSVYIFSDTHFEDFDCKLMDPDWITPQEQIDIINKLVHKNDCLILLGDVGDIEWIKKLKAGYKVLITGNHDAGAENYKRKIITKHIDPEFDCDYSLLEPKYYYEENEVYDNHLFDEVYTGPLMISDKIILSHEPIPNINWALNICGHDHSASCNDKYHYCVCSNTINYTPVNLKDIINSGILNRIDSLHRITIDNATKHPMHKKRK